MSEEYYTPQPLRFPRNGDGTLKVTQKTKRAVKHWINEEYGMAKLVRMNP